MIRSIALMTRPSDEYMQTRGIVRTIKIASFDGQNGKIGQTNSSTGRAGMAGFTRVLARKRILLDLPAGRFGAPEDMTRVVAFMALLDNCNSIGAILSVDGRYPMA